MWDIIKLQGSYKIEYGESHNYYQSFQTSAFTPDDELALAKTYTRKRPIGLFFMIRQNIKQEYKHLNALLMALYRYDKNLN